VLCYFILQLKISLSCLATLKYCIFATRIIVSEIFSTVLQQMNNDSGLDMGLSVHYRFVLGLYLPSISITNKKAVLSQGEPRDATANFDKYRILQ